MTESVRKLECMDVPAWRALTKLEMRHHLERIGRQNKETTGNAVFKSILAVRNNLSPLDMYCYLKARFGEPNGFQNFLRRDSSHNLFHWDFNLKAAEEDVYIVGTFREIHLALSEELADNDWPNLIRRIKSDYGRVGTEKGDVLNSLEKWVIFPNKFVAVAEVCADLHFGILQSIRKSSPYKIPPIFSAKSDSVATDDQEAKVLRRVVRRSTKLYRDCLELSLMTPVLAEAFINMAILILCKKRIRENKRQFDAFIRSNIDVKIFDLPDKCTGFARRIDQNSPTFKRFMTVMQNRNNAIHGNVDPQREQTEVVYFDGRRPLFRESGDHISIHFETLARQFKPEAVVKDYEDTYEFLVSLAECLKPSVAKGFWQIIEDPRPGFDLGRRIMGCLMPEVTVVAHMEGMKYDDELPVSWAD
jgi:hypothetical protein